MKKLNVYIKIFISLLVLSSCTREEGGVDNVTFVSKDNAYFFESSGSTINFSFNTSNKWFAKTKDNSSWITAVPSNGNGGDVTMNIKVDKNETFVDRKTSLVISCGTYSDSISISQKAKDYMDLSLDEISAPYEGGLYNIEIKSNIDASFVLDKNIQSWCFVSSENKRLGVKKLQIRLNSNDDIESRHGVIRIIGNNIQKTVTINQAGATISETTVNEPGILRQVMGGKEAMNSVVALRIHGSLNGTDIEDIRNMTSLAYLDIEDVRLVPGGVYMGNNEVKENEIDNWMFYKLENLHTIILPSNVTYIGFHAFDGCKNMEKCILPEKLKSIGYASFADCSSLKEIHFPEETKSIGYCSFCGCTTLSEIVIPNNVTYLGPSSFSRCSNLKKITLGNGLWKIDTYAFYEDKNITDIYVYTIPGTESKFATNIFDESIYNTATLYIPYGTKDSFIHTPFENFKKTTELK